MVRKRDPRENNCFHPSPGQSDIYTYIKKIRYKSPQSITGDAPQFERAQKTFYCLTWPRQMTKVNLHINRQTLEIREVARDCSIMHEISMWGITTNPHRAWWSAAHPCRNLPTHWMFEGRHLHSNTDNRSEKNSPLLIFQYLISYASDYKTIGCFELLFNLRVIL